MFCEQHAITGVNVYSGLSISTDLSFQGGDQPL